jgi:hypothetical protein
MAGKSRKSLLVVCFVVAILITVAGLGLYAIIYRSNVELGEKHSEYLFVRSNWTYADVVNSLVERKIISSKRSFEWVAHAKKYDIAVKPGRYRILDHMNNTECGTYQRTTCFQGGREAGSRFGRSSEYAQRRCFTGSLWVYFCDSTKHDDSQYVRILLGEYRRRFYGPNGKRV